jgi:hypothetical protein
MNHHVRAHAMHAVEVDHGSRAGNAQSPETQAIPCLLEGEKSAVTALDTYLVLE